MKRCSITLKKVSGSRNVPNERDCSSVETVLWKVKSEDPLDITDVQLPTSPDSEPEFAGFGVVTSSNGSASGNAGSSVQQQSVVEPKADKPAETRAMVQMAVVSTPQIIRNPTPFVPITAQAAGSGVVAQHNVQQPQLIQWPQTAQQSQNAQQLQIAQQNAQQPHIAQQQRTVAPLNNSTGPVPQFSRGSIVVNCIGEVQPPPSDAAVTASRRNRELCTILGRAISTELLVRGGVVWPHSVWTATGSSSKSFVVRAPNPVRSPQNTFVTGVQIIDLQRISALLQVLQVEYDFTLDLF